MIQAGDDVTLQSGGNILKCFNSPASHSSNTVKQKNLSPQSLLLLAKQ